MGSSPTNEPTSPGTARPKPISARGKQSVPPPVRQLSLSRTWCFLFVGLDGPDEDYDFIAKHEWIFPSWDHQANVEAHLAGGIDSEFPAVFITSPSAKDGRCSANGAHPAWQRGACVLLLAITEWSHWQRFVSLKDDDTLKHEYAAIKKSLEKRLLRTLYSRFPLTEGHVKYTSMSTPLAMNTYLGTTQGEVNGLAVSCKRFSMRMQMLLRPKTPVKGLYLSGHDISHQGLHGALMSSIYTIFACSPRSMLSILPMVFLDWMPGGSALVALAALAIALLAVVLSLLSSEHS